MKKCISILTRGYQDFSKYDSLLQRNQHIERHLGDKTIDLLLFHEGNIREDHQMDIRKHTPSLKNMKFIDISEKAFRKEKNSIRCTTGFSTSYKHMCSFWFVDFWHYVKDYDTMLRIDEDCNIEFNIDSVFSQLEREDCLFVAGIVTVCLPSMTVGLNDFTLQFMETTGYHRHPPLHPKPASGPYTNVFGIDLRFVRHHPLLVDYIDQVDRGDYIYSRRWGDLPLWGEAIHYIFGPDSLYLDNNLCYYHGSHKRRVNPKP